MLSPTTLNRVSHSYRRGYYDGYDQKPNKNLPVEIFQGVPMKPFSDYDYSEGYKAGLNDYYWEAFRSGKVTEDRETFMGRHA